MCSSDLEWDHRILMIQPGEVYEMPNISRFLVRNAMRSGEWDSFGAVADFFKTAKSPEWERIPALRSEERRVGKECRSRGSPDQ